MTDVASVPDSVQSKPFPGLVARLVGVLLSPRETFAAVAAKPRWLGVMLVTLAMSSVGYYVILSAPAMQEAIVAEVDAAVVHAKESPWPDPAELTRYVYPEEAVRR